MLDPGSLCKSAMQAQAKVLVHFYSLQYPASHWAQQQLLLSGSVNGEQKSLSCYDGKLEVIILLFLLTVCAQLLFPKHCLSCNVEAPDLSHLSLGQLPHHSLAMSDTISEAEVAALVREFNHEAGTYLISDLMETTMRSVTTSLNSAII